MPYDYGGQAVIEGVMMRGPKTVSIAVRRPDREIGLERRSALPWSKRHPLLGLPLIRGVVALVESLVIGINALMLSAKISAPEEEEMGTWEIVLSLGVAVILAVGLFVVGPTYLADFLSRSIPSPVLLNLAEGAVRVALLLLYIYSISMMEDIRRVLQYHGAEHKVIHAYEAGEELTVENARKHTTLHPRCGTSFLFLVAVISILIYSFFGWPDLWLRITIRLLVAPLVAGVSYEALKLSGRSRSPLVMLFAMPGLMLQKLSTREPDDEQIEVAIKAFEGAYEG